MYHNITLKLMFFAGDRPEWRVYTDSGMYQMVKTIEEIPRAVKDLLAASAQQTLNLTNKEPEDAPKS
jgi:lipopolysaccharide export system protein LptC